MARPPGPFPSVWTHPYDKERTLCHRGWSRAKAQAKYRGEDWQLTADDWKAIWTPELHARRGRGTDDLCLFRIDSEKSWHKDNVILITRRAQLIRQHHPDTEFIEVEPNVFDITHEEYARWTKRKQYRAQAALTRVPRKLNASNKVNKKS